MKKLLMTTGALLVLAAPAYAQMAEDDPLHGCYTTGCTTFGAVSIGTTDSFSNWGFSVDPTGQTGKMYIDLLVPDNEGEVVFPTLTGKLLGVPLTISSFTNVGLFTPSGTDSKLENFAGPSTSAKPDNPYSAYAPDTATLDSGFVNGTDFYTVYQATIDLISLNGANGQTTSLNDVFSFTGGDYTKGTNEFTGIGPGAIITAFLDPNVTGGTGGGKFIATAPSSSLILDVPGVMINPTGGVPEIPTWAMGLVGFGLMASFAALGRGRKVSYLNRAA